MGEISVESSVGGLRDLELKFYPVVKRYVGELGDLFDDVVGVFDYLVVDGLDVPMPDNTPEQVLVLLAQAIRKDLIESFSNMLNGHLTTAGFLIRRALDLTKDVDAIRRDHSYWIDWVTWAELDKEDKEKWSNFRHAYDDDTREIFEGIKHNYKFISQSMAHAGLGVTVFCRIEKSHEDGHVSLELSPVDDRPVVGETLEHNYRRFGLYTISNAFRMLRVLRVAFRHHEIISDKFDYYFEKAQNRFVSRMQQYAKQYKFNPARLIND